MKEREFNQNKKIALDKLKKAKLENKVDKDIIPIIDLLNSYEEYYTSSSCFGRIVLLELPSIGDKKNAKFLGKWHRTIKEKELLDAFKNASKGQIWFLAQAPIIHLFSKDLDSGDKLVKKAVSCGFKNSGFRSIKKNIVIEITSTERIDCPLGIDNRFYEEDDFITLLVNSANKVIKRSTKKLQKFKKELEKK